MTDLLVILALATFALAIGFAAWSKARTNRKLADENAETSALARETPDPKLTPSARVTDPHGVAHNA